MIDLLALAAVERETEMTYIRKERDWAERARAEGRLLDPARLLPVLPPSIGGNGHGNGNGNGHAHGAPGALPATAGSSGHAHDH